MSKWRSDYEAKGVRQLVLDTVNALESVSVEGVPEADLSEYVRLLKVLKILEKRLEGVDPELFPHGFWSSFPSCLTQVRDHVSSFGQTKSVHNLDHANQVVDHLLNIFRQHDAGPLEGDTKSIGDAYAVFQEKIIEELDRVRSRSRDINGDLEKQAAYIVQLRQRVEETEQVIQQQKTRLDQSIAEFQQQFSEDQNRRVNSFAEALQSQSSDFAAQGKEFEARFCQDAERRHGSFEELQRNMLEKVEAHSRFMSERKEQVDKIFGAIGTTAFAGNFKATADYEAKAADRWRVISVGFMTLMVCMVGLLFYQSIERRIDWQMFLFRFGTVIVMLIPAAYSAKESSKHRDLERLNRKLHLELASIDAYLVLLPEEQRNQIKGQLTERFFGSPNLDMKPDEVSGKDLLGLVKAVLNNLTKGK